MALKWNARPVTKSVLMGNLVHATESQKKTNRYREACLITERLSKDENKGEVCSLGYASVGTDAIPVALRHCRMHNVLELDLRSNGITADGILFLVD